MRPHGPSQIPVHMCESSDSRDHKGGAHETSFPKEGFEGDKKNYVEVAGLASCHLVIVKISPPWVLPYPNKHSIELPRFAFVIVVTIIFLSSCLLFVDLLYVFSECNCHKNRLPLSCFLSIPWCFSTVPVTWKMFC